MRGLEGFYRSLSFHVAEMQSIVEFLAPFSDLRFKKTALTAVQRINFKEPRVEAWRLVRRQCEQPGKRGWWLDVSPC